MQLVQNRPLPKFILEIINETAINSKLCKKIFYKNYFEYINSLNLNLKFQVQRSSRQQVLQKK